MSTNCYISQFDNFHHFNAVQRKKHLQIKTDDELNETVQLNDRVQFTFIGEKRIKKLLCINCYGIVMCHSFTLMHQFYAVQRKKHIHSKNLMMN